MIQFTATIWKQGNSYVITVPADFVNHDALQKGIEYEIQISKKTGHIDLSHKAIEKITAKQIQKVTKRNPETTLSAALI